MRSLIYIFIILFFTSCNHSAEKTGSTKSFCDSIKVQEKGLLDLALNDKVGGFCFGARR
jgi:hypothetical protein